MNKSWYRPSVSGLALTVVMVAGLTTSPSKSVAQVATPSVPKPNLPSTPALPTGRDLIVQVDGLRNANGNVCVSLFSSATSADFPSKAEKASMSKCAKINSALSMQVVLSGVEPGTYALSLLHDANMDGTPNRENGIPSEGFGFSQNPPLNIEPPKFSEASFAVAPPRTTIRVKVNYLQ